MRAIWIAEQKRREEKRERDAQTWGYIEDEDLDDNQSAEVENTSSAKDEEMADEIAQQEEAEMEALLLMLETESWDPPPEQKHIFEDRNTPYGSDDDEYDQLFMELGFDEADGNLSSQLVQSGEVDHDMMDMS
jgi:hypothetical protein